MWKPKRYRFKASRDDPLIPAGWSVADWKVELERRAVWFDDHDEPRKAMHFRKWIKEIEQSGLRKLMRSLGFKPPKKDKAREKPSTKGRQSRTSTGN